ncbi:Large-conductance mechanosensitive channel [Planctomycetes bacterium Pla163]|uniref:Large-conductance mechanosensitive channel n=2 Tax=Rohdeia mirabilis TaxID=2528008 RepID=A0A518CZJ9_9BACT|nr:Large-conductance mechanosensitive channel [Planctomycetes bacterium Pla163]
MGMLKEFKDFAVKGNVMDMAIGIIIGGAFTPIVKSMVDDIIMPPIGMLLGGVDFSEYKLVIQEASVAADGTEVAAVAINYGNFINICITFVIIAFAVFMLVKGMNRLRREEEAAPAAPTTKDCPHCLMSIPIAATKCGHCTSPV